MTQGPDLRALLMELERRRIMQEKTSDVERNIRSELFAEQVAFLDDSSRQKLVLGSRRAGKTEMWARYAVITALRHGRVLIRLWANSRLRAKELLMANLTYLTARHGIPVKTHETELTFTFDNGSIIRLVGAAQDRDIQKKRGEKTKLEVVLEAQNFPGMLGRLVEDVIEPSLMDLQGTVCLEGTPGPVCAGYWYDASGEDTAQQRWTSRSGWSCHRWTILNNPFIPHARAELERIKKLKCWDDKSPTFLREYCGKWVHDNEALYYTFGHLRNTYDTNKVKPYGPGWYHSLGWDLGFRDDMAFVVFGWHPQDPNIYEVYSWKRPKVTNAKEVLDEMDAVEARFDLRVISSVADTGGGGRMYVEEIMQRYGRHFKAAKKTEKYEHTRLINDRLSSGTLKLVPNSPLALEMAALVKDPDWPPPDRPEAPPREDPSCANHCCDAAAYALREAFAHTMKEPRKRPPAVGTPDWAAGIEDALRRKRASTGDFQGQLEQGAQYGFGSD